MGRRRATFSLAACGTDDGPHHDAGGSADRTMSGWLKTWGRWSPEGQPRGHPPRSPAHDLGVMTVAPWRTGRRRSARPTQDPTTSSPTRTCTATR